MIAISLICLIGGIAAISVALVKTEMSELRKCTKVEPPSLFDGVDEELAKYAMSRMMLDNGLPVSFSYHTLEELSRMCGIPQEELKRRLDTLEDTYPWLKENFGLIG